jgi:hypothetical protein
VMRPVRYAYNALLVTGPLSVVALVAMVVVSGGWQAVAAFALLFLAFGSLVSFIVLLAMSEQPVRSRPAAMSAPRPAPPEAPELEPERRREPLVVPEPVLSP